MKELLALVVLTSPLFLAVLWIPICLALAILGAGTDRILGSSGNEVIRVHKFTGEDCHHVQTGKNNLVLSQVDLIITFANYTRTASWRNTGVADITLRMAA